MIKKIILVFAVFLVVVIASIGIANLQNIRDGKERGQLKVTLEHPFYVEGKWIKAEDLKIGDELTTADGRIAVVKSMQKIEVPESITVYNLEDELYHNYIVDNIIVHNSEWPGPLSLGAAHDPGYGKDWILSDAEIEKLNEIGPQLAYLYDTDKDAYTAAMNEIYPSIVKSAHRMGKWFWYSRGGAKGKWIEPVDAEDFGQEILLLFEQKLPTLIHRFNPDLALGSFRNFLNKALWNFGKQVEGRFFGRKSPTTGKLFEPDDFKRRLRNTNELALRELIANYVEKLDDGEIAEALDVIPDKCLPYDEQSKVTQDVLRAALRRVYPDELLKSNIKYIKEYRVGQGLIDRLTVPEISRELGILDGSVRYYRDNFYNRLAQDAELEKLLRGRITAGEKCCLEEPLEIIRLPENVVIRDLTLEEDILKAAESVRDSYAAAYDLVVSRGIQQPIIREGDTPEIVQQRINDIFNSGSDSDKKFLQQFFLKLIGEQKYTKIIRVEKGLKTYFGSIGGGDQVTFGLVESDFAKQVSQLTGKKTLEIVDFAKILGYPVWSKNQLAEIFGEMLSQIPREYQAVFRVDNNHWELYNNELGPAYLKNINADLDIPYYEWMNFEVNINGVSAIIKVPGEANAGLIKEPFWAAQCLGVIYPQ